jgi:hypothetical protein
MADPLGRIRVGAGHDRLADVASMGQLLAEEPGLEIETSRQRHRGVSGQAAAIAR